MQSSVLCGVRVNMMERRPLVAIGRKATDRIRDNNDALKSKKHLGLANYI